MSVRQPESRESRLSVVVSYVSVTAFWVGVIVVTGFIGGVDL